MAHLLQDYEDEFRPFCQLIKDEGARSYLEIGSFSGGSIEVAAQYLPVGSRIVSVDMPWKPTKLERLRGILQDLKKRGYDTHLIVGDSTAVGSIKAARKLAPFDAVFIDGNHTLPFVKSDWENYGRLGRLVGFHDVAKDKPPHGASGFWNQIKSKYKHVEFISDATRARTDGAFGIGVLWNV